MTRFISLAMLAPPLCGCATVPASPLADDDQKLVCEVLLQVKPAGSRMGNDRGHGASRGADAALYAGDFRSLPKRISCNGKSLKLVAMSREGYGSFLSSYWIAPDRQSVTFEGGYLAAPLLGGSGMCTYRRTASGWTEEGCSALSAI
jgi:hypothetical protein